MYILILILTIFLGCLISYFIIIIQSLKKEFKRLKNTCKTIGEDVYNISSRISSGNASHSKGNIQNMCQLLIQLGEKQ